MTVVIVLEAWVVGSLLLGLLLGGLFKALARRGPSEEDLHLARTGAQDTERASAGSKRGCASLISESQRLDGTRDTRPEATIFRLDAMGFLLAAPETGKGCTMSSNRRAVIPDAAPRVRAATPLWAPGLALAGQTTRLRGLAWPVAIDPRIRRVERLMRRDLHRPVRVPELAARTGLSVSRLAHVFRTETGISPGHYLKSLRLREARELLESSSLSVKEIAARVGFHLSKLVREFRLACGTTPRQYRLRFLDSDVVLARQEGIAPSGSIPFAPTPLLRAVGKFDLRP